MIITAQIRSKDPKHQVSILRKDGKIPAVVYGEKRAAESLFVDAREFEKIYASGGESTLIDLSLASGSSSKVLIKDVQHDVVTGQFLHIDFFEVDMEKPLEAEVELHFEGVSPAVKELGGILNKQLETITIRCLPKDLVHAIIVPLEPLRTFEDMIHVKDIVFPEGVTVLQNLNDVVVMVSEPMSEAELKAMEEAPVTPIGEPVVAGKEEKKEEEGEKEKK